MNISIRSGGETINLDIPDEEMTILELKQLIIQQKPNEISAITLIYNGRFLEDDFALYEYDVRDGDFIMMMIKSGEQEKQDDGDRDDQVVGKEERNVERGKVLADVEGGEKVEEDKRKGGEDVVVEDDVIVKEVKESVDVQAVEIEDEMDVVIQEVKEEQKESDSKLASLCALGFDISACEKALEVSSQNLELAVEYLTTGFPEETIDVDEDPMDIVFTDIDTFLRSNLFLQLKGMVQSEPHMLQKFITEFTKDHPELLYIIQNNKKTFTRALSSFEIPTQANLDPQDYSITNYDKEIISNLCQLGSFKPTQVTTAYLQHNKDETATANYLLNL
eukprot:TRINITY_DN4454_c0_g1_i1.p1 TRINITY_DN4454_c0_g1~~TRINITY_DN4454_c0_g1_i1.p1  ORF type:complete len:334 (-),score=95.08 TRINITY_DN4454_c0_g1_i1:66-1067(-)